MMASYSKNKLEDIIVKTFRVYFRDGNQKLYEAPHIQAIIEAISEGIASKYEITDVVKIEEVFE